MRTRALVDLMEALGAVLVVAGLVFVSLPLALITAGVFLVVVANAPGEARPAALHAARRGGLPGETP